MPTHRLFDFPHFLLLSRTFLHQLPTHGKYYLLQLFAARELNATIMVNAVLLLEDFEHPCQKARDSWFLIFSYSFCSTPSPNEVLDSSAFQYPTFQYHWGSEAYLHTQALPGFWIDMRLKLKLKLKKATRAGTLGKMPRTFVQPHFILFPPLFILIAIARWLRWSIGLVLWMAGLKFGQSVLAGSTMRL